ncbi:MAG: hypothetical protein K1X88_30330 [Nannocystaceae bacterium]|nr:hypothetical protein [Nannocystaceae bacterium]
MLRVGVLALAWLLGCNAAKLCEDRGGVFFDSELDPRLPGSCVMAAVDAGQQCTEGYHCLAGWCACSDGAYGEGAELPESASMVGTCPSFPPRKGDGWHCAVVGGHKHKRGVIAE